MRIHSFCWTALPLMIFSDFLTQIRRDLLGLFALIIIPKILHSWADKFSDFWGLGLICGGAPVRRIFKYSAWRSLYNIGRILKRHSMRSRISFWHSFMYSSRSPSLFGPLTSLGSSWAIAAISAWPRRTPKLLPGTVPEISLLIPKLSWAYSGRHQWELYP